MEDTSVLDQKIDELKWRSLPVFERLTSNKHSIHDGKFYLKKRQQEMRWFVQSCNTLLVLFAGLSIYAIFSNEMSGGFQAFCLVVLMVLLAQKAELSMRFNFLREARYLKHLKKEIKN